MGRVFEEIKQTLAEKAVQGRDEVSQILPAFPDSVQPVNSFSGFGSPSQGELVREQTEPSANQQMEVLHELEL